MNWKRIVLLLLILAGIAVAGWLSIEQPWATDQLTVYTVSSGTLKIEGRFNIAGDILTIKAPARTEWVKQAAGDSTKMVRMNMPKQMLMFPIRELKLVVVE